MPAPHWVCPPIREYQLQPRVAQVHQLKLHQQPPITRQSSQSSIDRSVLDFTPAPTSPLHQPTALPSRQHGADRRRRPLPSPRCHQRRPQERRDLWRRWPAAGCRKELARQEERRALGRLHQGRRRHCHVWYACSPAWLCALMPLARCADTRLQLLSAASTSSPASPRRTSARRTTFGTMASVVSVAVPSWVSGVRHSPAVPLLAPRHTDNPPPSQLAVSPASSATASPQPCCLPLTSTPAVH